MAHIKKGISCRDWDANWMDSVTNQRKVFCNIQIRSDVFNVKNKEKRFFIRYIHLRCILIWKQEAYHMPTIVFTSAAYLPTVA